MGFADIDILRREVIGVSDRPVFEHGAEDSYYSHGVSIGNYYEINGQRYILFMGWHTPKDGHWRGEIGRLRLGDDFSLAIDGEAPFIGLSAEDPISLSYPWVMPDPQGGYHMWYGSTTTWDAGNLEMLHVIRHAHSDDGDHWHADDHTLPFMLGVAQAFSRPTVIHDETGYHMWFSYRSGTGETYRIGHAWSVDARKWTLKPSGVDVSDEGWDSEMIEYPFVFEHAGCRFMLYNGNEFGGSGFGLAIADD
ncbi:glycoside hydrolase family protein [Mesorhizobium sp. A623]